MNTKQLYTEAYRHERIRQQNTDYTASPETRGRLFKTFPPFIPVWISQAANRSYFLGYKYGKQTPEGV